VGADSVAKLDQAVTGEFETFPRSGLRIHGRSLRSLGLQPTFARLPAILPPGSPS
jgi:hypothetical protein